MIVKATREDVAPLGLTTAIVAVIGSADALTRSLAGIRAVTWVLLTKVVGRSAPFHFTVVPLRKLVPLMVSVKAEPEAAAPSGDRLPITGTRATVQPTWGGCCSVLPSPSFD